MKVRRANDRTTAANHARGRGPHFSLERRLHPRQPAVDYRIWVGGWSEEGEFTTVAARVDDVSRGGARLLCPIAFAEGDDVWLKPGGAEYAGCVRGEVLQSSPDQSGAFVTRVRFHEECPDPFFSIVARGIRG